MNKLLNNLALFCLLLLFGCGPAGERRKGLTTPDNDEETPSPSLLKCNGSSLSKTLPKGESKKTIARYVNGPLFNEASGNMPEIKDVIQAGFNVCYFYAFLSSYVARHPQKIKDSITEVKDGFEVTVHDPASTKPCVFISNLQLAIFRQSGRVSSKTLWPEVLTGAWVSNLKGNAMKTAVDDEIKNTGTDRALGVSELQKGNTIDLSLTMKDPFKYFLNETGKARRIKPKVGMARTPAFLIDADELLDFVDDCVTKGCVMYAYIAPGGDPPGPKASGGLPNGLYDHHCYGVMSTDMVNDGIFVRNPHGGKSARSVAYAADGVTMKPGIQVNEKFYLRAPDFFKQFYTLQFSQF